MGGLRFCRSNRNFDMTMMSDLTDLVKPPSKAVIDSIIMSYQRGREIVQIHSTVARWICVTPGSCCMNFLHVMMKRYIKLVPLFPFCITNQNGKPWFPFCGTAVVPA